MSAGTPAGEPSRAAPPATRREVFRRTAARVGGVGGALACLGLLAGLLAGGRAWGGAAGALLTAITAAALAVPWDRFPLLASSGVMLSFLGKSLVMIGVVLLAGPHKSAMSPAWFLGTLAAVLLGVAAVEIASLAAARSPTVESGADGE